MRLLRRFRYLLRQRRETRELAEEMDLHRAMVEDAQRSAGLPEDESRAAARRLMGNATLASENVRRVWLAGWIEGVVQDLRYAARSLASQPTFTGMALLALVLGIGLNTSVFTAINSLWSRPWDVPEPKRVVGVYTRNLRFGVGVAGLSLPSARFLNENSRTLEGAAASRASYVRLDGVVAGPSAFAEFVTGNFLDLLHVALATGRTFRKEEDVTGSPLTVAVISHFLWTERYHEDPNILGRTILLDGVPFTVIGVVAEPFEGIYENRTDVWAPLATLPLVQANDPSAPGLLTDPRRCCVGTAARLRPGISREQAQAELNVLAQQFSLQHKLEPVGIALTGTAMLDHPQRRRRIAPVLAIVLAAFGSILLLACANVSNLLLARAAARQREIAVRLAIGAGRWRIVRQLFTESLLLSGIASGLGLLLAYFLPNLALRFMGQTPPTNLHLTPDSHVLAYSVGIAMVSAVAFGLAPAMRGTHISVNDAMKRQSAHASPRIPLRGALLGLQVAISVALLMAAGLLVRGLERARSLDPGFQTEGVSAVQVTLPPNAYDLAREAAFYDDLVSRLEAGGEPVAVSLLLPLGDRREFTDFGAPCANRVQVMTQRVSQRYFDVLRIPIVAGRNFLPEDRGRGSIVVNETLARTCWPGRSPVGETVTIGGRAREVVGVVRDAQVYSIGTVQPIYFAPFVPDGNLVDGPTAVLLPSPIAARAVEVLREMDSRVATEAIPLTEQLERSLGDTAGVARMAGALGVLALLLATVGVYGVISYSVEQRRREIGVRMALGARAGQVVGLVLRRNARAVAIGLAVGIAIGAAETAVLKSELYGLSPMDPLAYVGVLALMLLSGVAASVIPARRALRTDAVTALHHE